MVKDINAGGGASSNPGSGGIAVYQGALYFSAYDGQRELWKSDGTAEGTVLIKDIDGDPTTDSFSPFYGGWWVIEAGVLFAADDGVHGCELWITDGSESGTRLVKDMNLGLNNGFDDRCGSS